MVRKMDSDLDIAHSKEYINDCRTSSSIDLSITLATREHTAVSNTTLRLTYAVAVAHTEEVLFISIMCETVFHWQQSASRSLVDSRRRLATRT